MERTIYRTGDAFRLLDNSGARNNNTITRERAMSAPDQRRHDDATVNDYLYFIRPYNTVSHEHILLI